MGTRKSVLFKEVSVLKRLCCESFFKKSVQLREVPALEDVSFREVSLYNIRNVTKLNLPRTNSMGINSVLFKARSSGNRLTQFIKNFNSAIEFKINLKELRNIYCSCLIHQDNLYSVEIYKVSLVGISESCQFHQH